MFIFNPFYLVRHSGFSRGNRFSVLSWAQSALRRGIGLVLMNLGTLQVGMAVEESPQSAEELVFGMSTVLSGPAASLGLEMQRGLLAGFARANREGGVNGRTLRLVTLDDGYEPLRTAPNMRYLIKDEKVLAVVGNVGTPTAVAAVPIANEEKTLLLAPLTGAGVLRKSPPDRYVVNYRASYAEEMESMIKALIEGAGLKPEDIAFFTQRDAYGDAGFAGGMAALKRYGLNEKSGVLHVRYERNTLAVENALATLLYAQHEPRAVIMVGAYQPCARFIQLAHGSGLQSIFLGVSFVGSDPLAAKLGHLAVPVIITQVVPHPQFATEALVQEYRADLAQFEPHAHPGFVSLEGYVAARILLRALAGMPQAPTRESLITAIENQAEFDLGLGTNLGLGPMDHQASHKVWPTILKGGAFVPFSWTEIAGLLPQRSPL